MGSLLSTFVQSIMDAIAIYWAKRRRILLLGLAGASKTTLLYNLKLRELVASVVIIGFNVETLNYKNAEFTADCISEAANELCQLFKHDKIKNVKLLVYANKQDLPGRMPLDGIREKLNLDNVTRNLRHTQPTVAVSGEGMYEGLEWLSKVVTGN